MQTSINLEPIRNEPLHLDQYFGLWAVEETRFLQMFDRVSKIDLSQHVRMQLQIESNNEEKPDSSSGDHHLEVAGGSSAGTAKPSSPKSDEKTIAVIDVNGTLTKRGSSLAASSSLVNLRKSIRSAANDDSVAAILLRIDSPGGTTAGTADLAKEVAAAADKKPCVAFVEDLCASAAYWVASQCCKIVANDATAMVGSIGTFIGLYDYSANAAMNGIKAITIKTGKYKAAGFAGSEITDEQKAHFQMLVDSTQAEFSSSVAKGRNLSSEKVAELADGRVHLAGDALKMGLIDGIQSYDATLAEMQGMVATHKSVQKTKTPSRSMKMSEQTSETTNTVPAAPVAATIVELKAGCPGASDSFVVKQLEKSATLAQAQRDFMAEQQTMLSATQKELADTKAAAAIKRPSVGVEALGNGASTASSEQSGDPIAEWNEKVEAVQTARKCDRQTALGIVGKQNPDLREAFVAAYNAAHPRHEEKK